MPGRQSVTIPEVRSKAAYTAPDVCIHCGEPAATKNEVVLRCPQAPWILYVAILFLAEMMETKISIVIPLCSAHRKAKDANTILKLIILFAVIPFVIVGVLVFATTSKAEDKLIGCLTVAAGLIIGWLAVLAVRARRFYCRPAGERHLELVGVAPGFAAAVSAKQKTGAHA
jgi:hypothetical protein